MKIILKWMMPILLLLFINSCKKGGTTDVPPVVVPDTTKPTISLVDITASKIVTLGTAMHLSRCVLQIKG